MTDLNSKLAAIAIVGALVLGGCGTVVERVEVDEVRDLSGEWNDTDSRLVSEEMIKDVLAHPWLGEFQSGKGARPAVIVGEIRNLSHEHINTKTFVADMERALINSAKVDFVASKTERQEIREERSDQEVHAREDTRKEMGQELGADYMLQGTINTIIDQEGKESIKYYQVDLTLISLVDNRKVWVGQKKVKKFVKKGALRL